MPKDKTLNTLTPKQYTAALQLALNQPAIEVAKDLDMHVNTLYGWEKDPQFIEYRNSVHQIFVDKAAGKWDGVIQKVCEQADPIITEMTRIAVEGSTEAIKIRAGEVVMNWLKSRATDSDEVEETTPSLRMLGEIGN